MKKIIAWALRIVCFVLILIAAITLVRCLLHIHDDYSEETLLGPIPVETAEPAAEPENTPEPVETAAVADGSSALETAVSGEDLGGLPTVVLTTDGRATANNPNVMLTAAFGNIADSILATLQWYIDGELVHEDTSYLVVEGSTATYNAVVEVTENSPETVDVVLLMTFDDQQVNARTELKIGQDSVVIRTQEIPVTALKDSEVYRDRNLENGLGQTMEQGDAGLLLDYGTSEDGSAVLRLQLSDGSEGWVDAEDMQITEADCTTDEDYTQEQKEEFINSMHYDSASNYLLWVSLYTQKVNVFTGYEDHWTLERVFDCSSGVNASPTTSGIFEVTAVQERWDLAGDTYVSPVVVFNGGEAFTSQPYDAETDQVADDTIGKPASGGGVRLLADDIEWLADNIPMDTLVVVY